MCELMGLTFARPLTASVSIRTFSGRGEENADGWGLAWYPDRAAAIVKEPVKWGESPFARFLEEYPPLRSAIYIAHVRHKTIGGIPCYADTHPFSRERIGREYCFAHNGTLEDPIWSYSTGHYTPLGATDSERTFCHLLAELDHRGGHLEQFEDWEWLHSKLSNLNRLGKLNVLLSDGVRLFAYHDQGAWKGLTIHRLTLDFPNEPQRLRDENISLELETQSSDYGYVIATYPLGEGIWTPFQTGELMVFETGRLRYSSHRDIETMNSPAWNPAPSNTANNHRSAIRSGTAN